MQRACPFLGAREPLLGAQRWAELLKHYLLVCISTMVLQGGVLSPQQAPLRGLGDKKSAQDSPVATWRVVFSHRHPWGLWREGSQWLTDKAGCVGPGLGADAAAGAAAVSARFPASGWV